MSGCRAAARLAVWLVFTGISGAGICGAGSNGWAQTRRALLIGINTYQPAGTTAEHPAGCAYGRCELGSFANLDGAVNDAQAMADVLTSPKFGFPARQVVLLTNPAVAHPGPGVVVLPAAQTDRAGILAAMQKYLVDVPQRGDTVVFYAASHGSLRVNSRGTKLKVSLNGQAVPADSTLVPADAYKGGYDVRDREMTRIYNAALDKGIHLTVILDSCHSGGITRGIGPKYKERMLPFDPRDIAEGPDLQKNGQPVTPPTEREENPALVLAAAQQSQTAKEMPIGGEPHGAFTAALVQALEVLPADAPASLVYERVKAVLEGSQVPDQEPDLDATEARRQRPLFGGAASAPGKVRTAAIGMNRDGTVMLDVGWVASVGVGSEFTSEAGSGGQKVVLRVTELEGIARSSAEVVNGPKVVSPAGAKVQAGDVFEMTKWTPAETPALLVWHWPANLSAAQIAAAAAQIQAAGVTSVEDPADDEWTHMLGWDGTNWLVQAAGASNFVTLGATLTADALKQHVPTAAKVWVNLPPPEELAAKLTPADAKNAVQNAKDLADAHYALTGVLTANGPAYAWFHKNELAMGSPAAGAANQSPNHSPGCSATSPYPVRSDWIAVNDAGGAESAAEKLNHTASLLAKVHGWLELANSPADGSTGPYYSLELVRAAASGTAGDNNAGSGAVRDQAVHPGDLLKMALRADGAVGEKRWVYVLDIDCHGQGTLLYPGDYTNNQFPNDSATGQEFLLPGAKTLRVGPPYGIDTMILLSTAQPLANPYVLNFEGVARTTRGMASPLEQLLGDTSAGTRGGPTEVPTSWGIGVTALRSVPQPASP